jgi:hypothetical protein
MRSLLLFAGCLFGALVGGWQRTAAASGPVDLARGEAPLHPQQPQVAIDSRGAIHVVFGVGDQIRYCHSTDGGATYSQPVDLPSVHEMSLGMRRGPRIVATSDAICVTAIGGKQGKGRDGDVLAIRSADEGRTWKLVGQVNDVADSAREGLHAMAASPSGDICCVWLDLRNRRTEVMGSVSKDGGATWGKNFLVYKSPDGSVCECCHPSVAYDRAGVLYVMWRNSLAGARDIYVASSADGGQSFGLAQKLGQGTWPLKACPMDGGALTFDTANQLATVWRREKTVYLTRAGDSLEQTIGPGEQPTLAANKAGLYIVWLKKRGETAYLLAPGKETPRELATRAADPVIIAGPHEESPIVAAWEAREGAITTLRIQIIAD